VTIINAETLLIRTVQSPFLHLARQHKPSRKHGKRCETPFFHAVWSWKCFFTVHGSLARAGKVKSQTPKAEKQEKRKTPKGRAKKRILYNRRCVDPLDGEYQLIIYMHYLSFVNVTLQVGAKRKMWAHPLWVLISFRDETFSPPIFTSLRDFQVPLLTHEFCRNANSDSK
jgi:ribosomal protein S30